MIFMKKCDFHDFEPKIVKYLVRRAILRKVVKMIEIYDFMKIERIFNFFVKIMKCENEK